MIIMTATNPKKLYREFIIHPGEMLKEALENHNMTQSELSKRMGVSPAYVNDVINGKKDISAVFATKLGYVFDNIDAEFWIKLQAIYDMDLKKLNEYEGVSEGEGEIVKKLKPIVRDLKALRILSESDDIKNTVIELRKLFKLSNLELIPQMMVAGQWRKSTRHETDIYVLYAWICMCRALSEIHGSANKLDINKLKARIPDIKSCMFMEVNKMKVELEKIFYECGIIFRIVKHYKGAPVHGYIETKIDGSLMMTITLRYAYADVFWFSLFHEIGHLINGDYVSDTHFIDFEKAGGQMECAADKYAANTLIDPALYSEFIAKEDFSSIAIEEFAKRCGVRDFCVIGRLQKDDKIPWNRQKLRYKWG